jgi:hypothetical protein
VSPTAQLISSKDSRLIVICCVAIIAPLLVVGMVSHGVLRHIVQTAPLWIAIVLATRRSPLSKWAALPCWVLWLVLMAAIWLYLLGWAKVVTGTFSATEIAMTLVVGLASAAGIIKGFMIRTGVLGLRAATIVVAVLVVQVAALRVSFLPGIAHR